MSIESQKYCFDTNCFIEPWNKFYSYTSHASYWDDIILPEIQGGNIIILDEVYNELKQKDDDILAWLKKHKVKDNNVVETTVDHARHVQSLLDTYPRLTDSSRGRSVADPFLIAYAKENNIPIVTLEVASGTMGKPRIPDVCKKESVACMSLYDFVDRMGISFAVK
ncbi:MAG: DUF4411 family protein [Candidatus Kaiserbacteria bacterium]|nr:DUF4411 family protein [Candidatus Kaiserbacteria bacterium]